MLRNKRLFLSLFWSLIKGYFFYALAYLKRYLFRRTVDEKKIPDCMEGLVEPLGQHDHLKNVLQSFVACTNLTEPIVGTYRLVTETELETSSNIDENQMPTKQRSIVGIATQDGVPIHIYAVPDYNYASLLDRTYDMIYKNISKKCQEPQISPNDVKKILKELSEKASEPKIVIIDYCPKTRRPRVSIRISYINEQLPVVLTDTK